MAKDKKTSARSDEKMVARTSFALAHEWMCVLQHLCTTRRTDLGTTIQGMLEKEVAAMPRTESDALRTIVRLTTGKSLRLSGQSDTKNAEMEAEPAAGQSDLIINRIAQIGVKSASPVDAALESLG